MLALLLLARPAFAAEAPTLPPGELRAGEPAVVRTVFRGDSVESFDAEIVGVLSGGRVSGDLIVARATSPRVVREGVAQGMSGSPVYVRGKLIGALSSSWTFSKDPLFGVTPIGEMLPVLELPARSDPEVSAGPAGADPAGFAVPPRFRELTWGSPGFAAREPDGDAGRGAGAVPTQASATSGAPAALPLPLAASGFSPLALDAVARWFSPLGFAVAPGGRATTPGPSAARLEPGSAVAVDLLTGDLQLSAIGTLTYRDGDRVLIFGHPFFQSGDVRLPLSTARITTIVSSQVASFKLGVRGDPAGVITQDRRTALGGRLGGSVRLLPIRIAIEGVQARPATFRFESIEDRTLAPLIVAIASLNSLLESGGSGGNQTLRWTLTLHRHGDTPLVLEDVVAGDSPPGDLVGELASPLRFLYANPWERLALDSVSVALRVQPGRELWTLRSARVLDPVVRPGAPVRVRCEVERWRGGRELRDLTLIVPDEAPDGRCVLWVGGGAELARFESHDLPARYRPTSMDDAWRRLAVSRPSNALYGAIYLRSPEVTSDGRDYPELPLSALSLLTSGTEAGELARRGDVAKLDERFLPMDGALHGELALPLTVDARAPLAGAGMTKEP